MPSFRRVAAVLAVLMILLSMMPSLPKSLGPVPAAAADVAFPFDNRRPFGTGTDLIRNVAMGDMDSDGDLDLVIGNQGQDVVYLNDGAGSFSTMHPFGATSDNTTSVQVGDMDNDGNLDIVIGNDGQQNAVYLNDGAANFSTMHTFGTGTDQTTSVAIGDMNNDSYLDLIVGNDGQNVVYLNDRTGRFPETGAQNFGTRTAVSVSVAVVDVDGDSYLDIITDRSGQNIVYLNDGTGTSYSIHNFGPGSASTVSVAAGDVDGNGYFDIIVGNSGRESIVYLNDGSGSFYSGLIDCSVTDPTKVRCFGNAPNWPDDITAGDVDSDGDLDLVAGSNGRQNIVYLNDGKGNFGSMYFFGTGTDNTTSVALGDVNSDGTLDVIAGNDGQQSAVYLNDGAGSFGPALPFGSTLEDIRSIALGDVDDDGDLDIASGGIDQSDVRLNDGVGNFGSPRPFGTGTESITSIALGDIDSDDDLDIVSGNVGQSRVYLNDSAGNFGSPRPFGTGTENTTSIALGDVDSDGDLDIVSGNVGQSRVYLNDSTGAFGSPRPFGTGTENTTSVALGDVDGDGDLDVISGCIGQSAVYLNDGRGNFGKAQTFGIAGQPTQSVAIGDMDSDGDLDIVSGNKGQQNLVYLNSGNGSFADTRLFGTGTDNTLSVVVGDINGDGYLDIISGNNTSQNSISLNDGHGDFTSAHLRLFGITENDRIAVAMAVGDVDDEGNLDLIIHSSSGSARRIQVYLNRIGQYLPNNLATIAITRPGTVPNANFYSIPKIQATNLITIPYTLADREGDPVRQVRAEFSLDGGGQWRPAIAATGTMTRDLFTLGSSLTLPGNNTSYAIRNPIDLAQIAVTVSFWMKTSDTTNDGTPFSYASSTNANELLISNYRNFQIAIRGQPTIPTGVSANDGNWHHIAVSWRRSDGQIHLYKDGFLAFSSTLAVGETIPTLGSLVIGQNQSVFGGGFQGRYAFQGSIDDLRVWNVVRSQAEIEAEMTQTSPANQDGLVAYWRFNDIGGATTVEQTAKRDFTLAGGATLADAGGFPHIFIWDTFASGFFGQSDNVVVRMLAYPALSSGPNGTPIFQRPYASATTFPFRVRGTQVRVVNPQNVGRPNAVVFRLNDQLSPDQQLFAASTTAPAYTTNTSGYLAGRGTLAFQDQLVALAPVPLRGQYAETYSQTVRLYATNIITTPVGISGFTVNSSGVQTVTVSLDHPFMLFDLKISLEWDARYDARYMAQLEGDLARASELLFQASHGQAALGHVAIFYDKEYWDYADIRIYASNRVRPSAQIGGVARLEIADPTTLAPITYGPGQVHMGATWNRFGSSTGSLSEDWPRTLVHELGHYLFFLEDNYLGLDPKTSNTLKAITTCPGLMSDTYAGIWQFQTRASWSPGCDGTFSNQTSERADWETIQTFYPDMKPPTQPIGVLPSGPIRFPLATTEITSINPLTPTARLDVPIFYTVDAAGARLIPGLTARGYLFQHSHGTPSNDYTEIIPLGRANTDQLLARGARVGDRICLFEPTVARFGCETISNGDELLTLRSQPWHPDIQVTPVTSTTLNVQVLGLPLNTPVLDAELYPLDDDLRPLPITLDMISNGIYSGTFKLAYPLAGAYIHLSTNDSPPNPPTWETVTSFALGGNGGAFSRIGGGGGFSRIGGGGAFGRIGTGGGFSRIGGGGGFMRTGSAPVSSAEGDVLLTGRHLDFALGQFLVLQTANSLPDVPSWATLIGQGYRFTTSLAPNAPDLTGTALSFSYLDSEVPPGQENGIQVYYRSPSATQWTAISTTLDAAFNLASIPTQGPGLYALMTSVHVPLLAVGWNNFSYPVSANREVGQALTSINGKYQIVYSHVPTATLDPWKVYAPAPAPAWVNDLKQLTFGHGYWIYMTEATDLLLNGGSSFRTATTGALSLPPAVIYGVAPTNVPDRQTVEAWVGSTLCGRGTTQLEAGQVVFKVKVAAIGLTTPNCGNTGSNVTITVAGNSIGSIAWDNTRASNLTPGFNHTFLPLIQR